MGYWHRAGKRGLTIHSCCVKGQEERYMRPLSRFEAKGYINSLTLSICSLFSVSHRSSQAIASQRYNSTQLNSTHLANPNLPFGTPTYGLVFLHQEV